MSLSSDMKAHNRRTIEEFRAAGGTAGERLMLLLTTTGTSSGQPHATPLMYVPDGDRLLVIASNAGAPSHPDWYDNLRARPAVTVEVAGETYQAMMLVTGGAEHDRLFAEIAANYPFFTGHQARVSRQIQVVVLVRNEESAQEIETQASEA